MRPRSAAIPAAIPVLIVIGAFDIIGEHPVRDRLDQGLLPVVAVGGSMYPAFTIALAHVRPRRAPGPRAAGRRRARPAGVRADRRRR